MRKINTEHPAYIGFDTISELIGEIEKYGEDAEIAWNSGGGSTYAGQQFADYLNKTTLKLNANVSGVAASMGAVLLPFFSKTIGANQADLMIHSCSGGAKSTIKHTNEFLYNALSKKIDEVKFKEITGKDLKEVMMAEDENRVDVWFTGKDAAYMGLFDESYDLLDKAASLNPKIDLSNYALPENIKTKYLKTNLITNNSMEIKDVTASMLLTGNKEAYDSIFEAGKKAEQTRVTEIMKYAQYDMNKANEIVKSGANLSIEHVEHFMEKKFDKTKLNELETGSQSDLNPGKPIVTTKEAKTAEQKEKEAAFDELNAELGLTDILKK